MTRDGAPRRSPRNATKPRPTKPGPTKPGPTKPASTKPATKRAGGARRTVRVREIDSLREELERRAAALQPARWNADPEEVQRSVARLVLTLIEFLRQLFEKQAIRRMEQGTLTQEETEKLGVALMRLEETVRDLANRFGLTPEELNLDLGPLGRLR